AMPTPRSRVRSRSRPGAVASEAADDELVRAVAAGDQRALAEIYRRYAGAVWAVARRVCNDRVLAEDVSQTVFADLWRRPGRFDPGRGRLRPWLVAQAHAPAVGTLRSATPPQRAPGRGGR